LLRHAITSLALAVNYWLVGHNIKVIIGDGHYVIVAYSNNSSIVAVIIVNNTLLLLALRLGLVGWSLPGHYVGCPALAITLAYYCHCIGYATSLIILTSLQP